MQKNIFGVSLFALTIFTLLIQKIFAAGINNIQINLSNSLQSGSGTVNISFEIENPIPANGKIEIEFPNNFSNLDLGTISGTNLGTTPVFATGSNATTILITLGTGGALTENSVTASGFILTNPSEDGLYLVQIRTYDQNSLLLGMGFKLVKIGTPLEIKSLIEESLVVSLDAGNVVFSPDPSVNFGQITDQASALTIQTNANTNYLVVGELAGNKLTSTNSQILSQDTPDDYFRIKHIELNLESGSGSAVSDNTVFSGATSLFQKTVGTSTNGDIISLQYDLNLSYFKEPGNYTGSLLYTVYPTF